MGLIALIAVPGACGTVADGSASVDATLADADQAHPWDDTTLAGAFAGGVHRVAGATQHHPVGLDPIDAFIRVTAE